MILPGRERRCNEIALTDLRQLATATIDELRHYLEPPFALAGVSVGAILAYEVAHRLQAAGMPPAALFLAGDTASFATGSDLLVDGGYTAV